MNRTIQAHVKTAIVATAFVTGLSACGSSFRNVASLGGPTSERTSGNGGNNQTSGDGAVSKEAWNNLSIEGTVTSGRWADTAQAKVLELDKTNKMIVIRLPMGANPFVDGNLLELPVKDVPGIQMTLEPMPDNAGTVLVLRIPLKVVAKGVDFLPAARLPNGDPLPAIADGELPSFAVSLTNLASIKASVYLGRSTVGIFVNTPFDPTLRLTAPIRDSANTRTWGYLSSIPAKSETVQGGFFISLALPDDIARIIDNNL